jgi:hypothetical protein
VVVVAFAGLLLVGQSLPFILFLLIFVGAAAVIAVATGARFGFVVKSYLIYAAVVDVFLLGVTTPAMLRFFQLSRDGVTTTAMVTRTEPLNHDTMTYEYKVGGRTFSGQGTVHDSRRTPNIVSDGDQVDVIYLPSDPAASCQCDPHYQLLNYIQGSLVGGFFLAIVGVLQVLSVRWWIRRSRSAIFPRRSRPDMPANP